MKEGLLSRPPGGPYPGRGGMVMRGPRPLLQQSPMAGGCVLMVYGLHQHKMNCDRVFNVLCCYGNVLKVHFKAHVNPMALKASAFVLNISLLNTVF